MKPIIVSYFGLAAIPVILSGCHTSSPTATATPPAVAAPTVSAAPPVSAAPTLPPAATIRINAGGVALKDATGISWLGDTGFEGGDIIERPDLPIANTKQPEIYRSEHYAMEAFRQKVPNGKYTVKLHFCETFEGISGPGERVFSFDVEGKPFKDFDVWVKSGGGAKAYVESVPVVVNDGVLDIKFTPNVENPEINAIEIIPE